MIKIDFNQSAFDTLPPILRTIINFEWVQVLIKPLKDNYDLFTGYTFDTDFEIYHNSQVLSFEDYLNTKIKSNYGGVTIENGRWLNYVYAWYQFEIDRVTGYPDKKLYLQHSYESIDLPKQYLYYDSESQLDTYDFFVKYHPEDLVDNPNYLLELTTWINKLKIIGTTYKFEEI